MTRASASLRIFSEFLTIEEITEILHLLPSDVRVKGTPRNPRRPSSNVWPYSVWKLDSGLAGSISFVEHFDTLLEKIEPARHALASLVDRCKHIDVFMGLFSEGTSDEENSVAIDHQRIARLAQLPLDFIIDMYPPVCETEHEAQADQRWSGGALTISRTQLSCAEITSLLMLEPTRPGAGVFSVSHPISISKERQEQIIWERESILPPSTFLDDHLAVLLSLAEERPAAFEQLSHVASLQLRLWFASNSGQGSFELGRQNMKRLAALPFDLILEMMPQPPPV